MGWSFEEVILLRFNIYVLFVDSVKPLYLYLMLKLRAFQRVRGGRGPVALMNQKQMRSALVRAIVLEYHNGEAKPFPRWGWERPTSIYVLRARRLHLASTYAAKHEAVSSLLFKHQLPKGKNWPGTRLLLSAPVFSWVEGVWTQVSCTVPHNPIFKPVRSSVSFLSTR